MTRQKRKGWRRRRCYPRYLPRALADLGWMVTVITPSYGFLHVDNPSKQIDTVHFPFGGKMLEGNMYEVTSRLPHPGVRNYVFGTACRWA